MQSILISRFAFLCIMFSRPVHCQVGISSSCTCFYEVLWCKHHNNPATSDWCVVSRMSHDRTCQVSVEVEGKRHLCSHLVKICARATLQNCWSLYCIDLLCGFSVTFNVLWSVMSSCTQCLQSQVWWKPQCHHRHRQLHVFSLLLCSWDECPHSHVLPFCFSPLSLSPSLSCQSGLLLLKQINLLWFFSVMKISNKKLMSGGSLHPSRLSPPFSASSSSMSGVGLMLDAIL